MNPGFSDVLIGLQYGDEGKAKVIDLIAKEYDIIARFNGGPNAGHTIETDAGRFPLHQIPSGVFYPNTLLYIGSGCVLNLEKLVAEIDGLKKAAVDLDGRFFISDQTAIIQPHHILLDEITGGEIGTTRNGIGPAYADKALRMDGSRLLTVRLGDLCDDAKKFFGIIEENALFVAKQIGKNSEEILSSVARLKKSFEQMKRFVQRDTLFLEKQVASGKNALFEGAQSCMLDVTRGLVPYVTSSNTVSAAAYVGGDLPPRFHRKTIGVAKAIMSRVGYGPFVSEFGGAQSEKYCMEGGGNLHNRDYEKSHYDPEKLLSSSNLFELGIALRIRGNEYGTVTGRPRRVGMLDLIQLAYAVKMNGVDEIFLTKCDLLSDFARTNSGKLPLVTSYTHSGASIDYVPGTNTMYREVEGNIREFPAFSGSLAKAKTWDDLPKELRETLAEVERVAGCFLMGIGTGPRRDQKLIKNS